MFESLELFIGQKIDLDHVLNNLAAFRYQKSKKSTQEGEFSQRGGILDVYPVGFDGPVRIDFDNEIIRSIASVNIKTGKLWKTDAAATSPHSVPVCRTSEGIMTVNVRISPADRISANSSSFHEKINTKMATATRPG